MNKIRISEYILSYRKEKGLNQTEFGELLGVTTQAVSKWEQERSYPDVTLLPRIAKLFSVTIDRLFD